MSKPNKYIILWLLSGCFLIYMMVLVGGITRLTGSGLSITEWNVIMGAIPPLNQHDWQEAFAKYQQSPQFQKVNFDMTLDEFKSIFFWEYIHRLLGRAIGVVFLIPFLYFLVKKQLTPALIKKLIPLFLLGGLQGAIGWYMVKSGLINNPHVSHYRLATHLITAFITFGFTFYIALGEMGANSYQPSAISQKKTKLLARTLLLITVLQIVYGAFVAGLHAGKIYNTFPKMGEEWIAGAVTAMQPFYKNLLENLAGVQFVHRCLAILVVVIVAIIWGVSIKEKPGTAQRRAVNYTLAAVALQFILGWVTLLYAAQLGLALLHQTGAFVLFAAVVYLNYNTGKVQEQY